MARGKLEQAWIRRQLILELAVDNETRSALADKYDVDQSAISHFATRHRAEIDDRRGKLDDEFFGLWIADKVNRVAEYQDDVERINTALDAETDASLLKAKLAVMRQVAEELGQLKTSVELTGKLTYVVEGVDLSRLQ